MGAALLAYLQSMTAELAKMARDGGFGTLAHIYDLAAMEAQPERLGHLSPYGTQRRFVGLWDWDGINDRMYFDEPLAIYYGLDPEFAAQGMPRLVFRSRIFPDDVSRVMKAVEHALGGQGTYSTECRIIDATGGLRWVYQKGLVQRDGQGRSVRFNGVTFDITGEKCPMLDAALH